MFKTKFFHNHPAIFAIGIGAIVSIMTGWLIPVTVFTGPIYAGFMVVRIQRGLGPDGIVQAMASGAGVGAMVGVVVALVPATLLFIATIAAITVSDNLAPVSLSLIALIFLAAVFVGACAIVAALASAVSYITDPKEQDELSEPNEKSSH